MDSQPGRIATDTQQSLQRPSSAPKVCANYRERSECVLSCEHARVCLCSRDEVLLERERKSGRGI